MGEKRLDSRTAKQMAVNHFNAVWDLIDKKERSEEDTRRMVQMAHISAWGWENVDGHTNTNLSVGYWQIARVYALANSPQMAVLFAKKCIEVSTEEVEPFFLAYGYEALARGLVLEGKLSEAAEALVKAKKALKKSAEEELDMIKADILDLEQMIGD